LVLAPDVEVSELKRISATATEYLPNGYVTPSNETIYYGATSEFSQLLPVNFLNSSENQVKKWSPKLSKSEQR